MILTQGERAVWAVAFVSSLYNQGAEVSDQARANQAAVSGRAAVNLLRIATCPDGECDCDTVQMLRAMLGEE